MAMVQNLSAQYAHSVYHRILEQYTTHSPSSYQTNDCNFKTTFMILLPGEPCLGDLFSQNFRLERRKREISSFAYLSLRDTFVSTRGRCKSAKRFARGSISEIAKLAFAKGARRFFSCVQIAMKSR